MRQAILFFNLLLFLRPAFSQTTYTFNGNGNWTDPANWLSGLIPPTPIPDKATININPVLNGECVVNTPVRIPPSVNLKILSGKKIRILGDLLINYDSTVVIKGNVHVIDTSLMALNLNPSFIEQGIYQYTFSNTLPVFSNEDILVGTLNDGYIRKITGFSTSGNIISFQTTQANLEDVFAQGFFEFNLPTDSLLQRSDLVSSSYVYTFGERVLYQNSLLSIKLVNGSISLNPDWKFDFDFQNGRLTGFEAGCQNASLNSSFEVNIAASQGITLIDRTDTLKRLKRIYTKWIPVFGIPVPIVVVMYLDFICKYSLSADAAISKNLLFSSNNDFGLGIRYYNSQWLPSYFFTNTNSITPGAANGNANATINVAIIPTFSFQLYGVTGPYFSFGLHEKLKAAVASPSLNWDFSAGTWVKTTLGVKSSILGISLYDTNKSWDTDTFFYKTPFSINKISGDYQTGFEDQYLSQPVTVQVLDKLNSPQSNVPVYFHVSTGGGSVQDAVVLTNTSGYAETRWKLGSQFGFQYLEAVAKKADHSLIQNAPIRFAASLQDTPDSVFTDPRDGKTYTYRHIGTQVWMTQNLNYVTPGSTCFYGGNCAPYYRLYLWDFALTAAPPGWHLPTSAEWQTLINYLGGYAVAGGAMKSCCASFQSPNTGATNSSHFGGLPGGFVNGVTGGFSDVGQSGFWWSSTPYNSTSAFLCKLVHNSASAITDIKPKSYGFSIRCVRD